MDGKKATRKRTATGREALLSPEDRAKELKALQKAGETALEEQIRASLSLLETAVGGRAKLLHALAVSKHPNAKRFTAAVGKCVNGNKPLYDVLKASRMSADELINVFTEGSLVRSTVEAMVKLSDGLPGIMQTAVESAAMPGKDGFDDRRLLFEIAGVRKPEKHGGVNINLSQISFGSEGVFEKVVTKQPFSLHQNPFEIDVEAEEVAE